MIDCLIFLVGNGMTDYLMYLVNGMTDYPMYLVNGMTDYLMYLVNGMTDYLMYLVNGMTGGMNGNGETGMNGSSAVLEKGSWTVGLINSRFFKFDLISFFIFTFCSRICHV